MRHLFLITVCIAQVAIGQNLVPNPSLEEYTNCPDQASQIFLATPWTGPGTSTDYFNACAPPCGGRSVPCQNSISFQYAHSGDGMGGFWMYNIPNNNYREYLHVELLDTLLSSECYHVRFFVNLQNPVRYAVNNFGLHFSSSSIFSNGEVLSFIPHIMKFGNPIINDTINWIDITGVYIANGNENYITIGNFFDDNSTDTLNTGNGTYFGSYYFIDDVSVIPVDSLPGGMPAFAGNDTTIYYGDTVFIGQEMYGLNCNWYDEQNNQIATNISGINVSPDSSTYYVVEQILCSNTTYDTVWVTVDTSNIGIENWQNKLEVNLYPNPTQGLFFIEVGEELQRLTIEILDLNSRLIYQTNLYAENSVFELKPELSRGVYMVKITDPVTGQGAVKRLVVQ